ncbi:HAD-IA family hydrolase [Streptomyces azureus]|uniref:Putative phosphatase YfbT n=1 Tax=Streptomyces azureus TaxID=146537 RepID=A0A0K8PJ48_STRAJ|nr:HAD-IA family hydrolase [Streptomyces azureus]GAP47424.1 putative phosphatase YfbT [Streptomyces azureus]
MEIISSGVHNAKPHPGAYQLATTRSGIAAHRCVVVEDAPAGIAAGKAVCCTVIAVTSTQMAETLGTAF